MAKQDHEITWKDLEVGCSPRAGLALVQASRARALVLDRDYAVPEDIFALTEDVILHRIRVTYEALAEAVGHLEAATRLDPDAPKPLIRLVGLLEVLGETERLRSRLGALAERLPMDLVIQKKALAAFAKEGSRAKACRIAQTVLEIDPKDEEAQKLLKLQSLSSSAAVVSSAICDRFSRE